MAEIRQENKKIYRGKWMNDFPTKIVFFISPVRLITDKLKDECQKYVQSLEDKGYKVHWPIRDTDQYASELEICIQNCKAIEHADEVHIYYIPKSQGIHFDLGIAFAFEKKLVVAANEKYSIGTKSFAKMIAEWSNLKQ